MGGFGYRNWETLQEAVDNLVGPGFIVEVGDDGQAVVALDDTDTDEMHELQQAFDGVSPVALVDYGDGGELVAFTNLFQQADGSFEAESFDREDG